ncbi:ATP phosphoribosyltransferase regulatory subunit [Desulfitispora alkaliphila]|uniref:ATP phosphoribosyltransferase regulatory subunit n=1 Tax=Desulfitispora alkaliphila TaxID=622674 RepID=UPI003D263802
MSGEVGVEVPPGVKDLLPWEAKKKRKLENEFAQVFSSWGYDEVVTPTFEYDKSLVTDTGEDVSQQMYKFFDRDGKILALRPDMTTPIARLVTTRLNEEKFPQRLFYLANVFKYENPQAGRQREFYQAGAELIGNQGPAADAEIIALAASCLEVAGLKNFKIGVGQIQLFNGIMEQLNLPEEDIKAIKKAIGKKDLVGLEKLVYNLNISSQEQEYILLLPELHGNREVIDLAEKANINDKTDKALKNLREIFNILEAYKVTDKVMVDFGVLRGFDYYTGVVFEGYTEGLGFPICGGGRYDNLLGKFGMSQPATGFAVGLERIFLAKGNSGDDCQEKIQVLKGTDYTELIQKAMEMRKKGERVKVELD